MFLFDVQIHHVILPQVHIQFLGDFRLSVFFGQRQYGGFDQTALGWKFIYIPDGRFGSTVKASHKGTSQNTTGQTGCRFNHVWQITFGIIHGIHIFQFGSGMGLVLESDRNRCDRRIPSSSPKPGAVKREAIFHIECLFGIEHQFIRVMFAEDNVITADTDGQPPFPALFHPEIRTTYRLRPDGQNHSISICSNSRERKIKLH